MIYTSPYKSILDGDVYPYFINLPFGATDEEKIVENNFVKPALHRKLFFHEENLSAIENSLQSLTLCFLAN